MRLTCSFQVLLSTCQLCVFGTRKTIGKWWFNGINSAFFGGRYWDIYRYQWIYPPVMTNIAIEHHHFQKENSLYKSPFSIAMLNYRRVPYITMVCRWYIYSLGETGHLRNPIMIGGTYHIRPPISGRCKGRSPQKMALYSTSMLGSWISQWYLL